MNKLFFADQDIYLLAYGVKDVRHKELQVTAGDNRCTTAFYSAVGHLLGLRRG